MLSAEYLVTPHGWKRSIYHLRTEEGIVHYGIDRRGPEFTAAAGLTPDGYFVTCSIPWNKLAGLWEKREAVPGNRVRLALVRCDWNGESGSPPVKTSPYPLLYDGHNLYGYAEFILTR